MPVGFLSADQCRRYGRFGGEPTPAQLGRFFHLDQTDLDFVAVAVGITNRLGMAVQLATVRFLGTFLEDPADVPLGAVRHLVEQLSTAGLAGDVAEALGGLKLYRDAEVRWDHQAEIRSRFGYREFSEPGVQLGLLRWLYTRAWVAAERPSVLFDPGHGPTGRRQGAVARSDRARSNGGQGAGAGGNPAVVGGQGEMSRRVHEDV